MDNRIAAIVDLWEAALSVEKRPEDALALLADACALGLSEGDFAPGAIVARLQESFHTFHVTKHVRVVQ